MSVHVEWYPQRHDILHLEIEGDWTWDEMRLATDKLYVLLDNSSYPVSLIYDFRNAGRLPRNTLSGIRSLNRNPHPHSACTCLVGLNTLYRMILEVFGKLYGQFVNPHGVHLFVTLEEAVAFIDRKHEESQSPPV